MKIISRQTLKQFWERHVDAEEPLKAWFREASRSNWYSPDDIKKRYPSADILPGNRIILTSREIHIDLLLKFTTILASFTSDL